MLSIPQRLEALLNPVVVRVFAILLLGIAVVLSGSQIPGLQLLEHEHWCYHALLSLHIVGVVAGYISLVGPVLPAPCFSMRNGN